MTQALHILRYGEPEGLVLADVPAPAPLAGEVAIEVHVAGVNYPDLLVVRGIYQNLASLPFSPGKEIAGIVPENLDLADAIGLGLTFQTAHFALFARGQMKRGESVLVTGATGGVGISTVQLAKACGATVIAGCMTEAKAGFARAHGADHVIMLDRSDLEQTLKAEVAALTGGRGVDVVVDNLGNGIFEACLRALAWCGRIVVVGFAAGAPATLRSNYLLIKNISATGLHWSDYRDRVPEQVRDAQRDIFTLWRRGLLTSPVTDALRLEDAPPALRRIAEASTSVVEASWYRSPTTTSQPSSAWSSRRATWAGA